MYISQEILPKNLHLFMFYIIIIKNNIDIVFGDIMATIIIGAGAGGLACAIKLKMLKPDESIKVLERLSSAGKKILATGNGRCNLTNKEAANYKEVCCFFNSIGLILRNEEGRIYPYSLKAETVLNALTDACKRLDIEIITDCEVTKIDKGFTVYGTKGQYKAENIVVCTGGKAQKALGSNGSGYKLLQNLGHSTTPLSPALVQLTSSSKYPRAVKGTRTKCNITIELNGKAVKQEFGEVLFTDYGLSGIAVMNLSYIVSENFAKKQPEKCTAVIDLIPEITEAKLKKHIENFGSLKGILGTALNDIITKQAENNSEKIPVIAKNWRLIITGTKGFDFAQITNGGIPLNEINNFESKIIPNLYICGEILDKQFECGGFNLDFAWHSGIKTAKEIAKK